MAVLNLWAKLGFALLVVISLAILIERLTAANYFGYHDFPHIEELIISTTSLPSTEPTDSILNKEFAECLTEHSKFHFIPVVEKSHLLQLDGNEIQFQNLSQIQASSSCLLPTGQCMHHLLIDFSKLMESLHIKLQLIEPSVLFCLLPYARRFNVLTRGYSSNKLRGARNVMTFGVTRTEAEILDEKSSRKNLISAGFRIWKFPKLTNFRQQSQENDAFEALHYIFKRQDLFIHLIVFYSRETFLWHSGVNATEIISKGILFEDDGAYDNFTVTPMELDSMSAAKIYLPSESHCFLLAMQSSKFLECSNISPHPVSSENPAFLALKELKKVLGSQMVSFWLWSRTLLGWFEQCDILSYTSDLELSIAVKSIKGYNFMALFNGSECHTTKQDFSVTTDPNIELNCQGMDVKISLMYENKSTAWYTYSNEQSAYRQTFPIFKVCSTNVLGLRVNIPCDTNKIFETEFGQNWRNTTLSFNLSNMINLSVVNKTSETE